MGYVLAAILCALVLAVVVVLWPDRDYYRYRPAYEGMHVLEQLVLKVLRESEEPAIRAVEISKRTGIGSRSITSGILERLAKQKRIERVGPRGPWKIRKP